MTDRKVGIVEDSIYEALKKAGVPLDHWSSDLYAKVNEKSREILKGYHWKMNVTTFISNIDGERWYEIPFAYDPYWHDLNWANVKKRGEEWDELNKGRKRYQEEVGDGRNDLLW